VIRQSKGQDGNYEVGYCRPPAQHRFTKGQSGNPSGRPKGKKKPGKRATLMELLDKVSQRMISITVNDRKVMMTMIEAILTRTAQQALAGKQDAVRTILNYQTEAERWVERFVEIPDPEELARLRSDPDAAMKMYERVIRGGSGRAGS
jgi:hypothetical protein